MKNEEKILELLAESLKKLDQNSKMLDKQGKTLDKHSKILDKHSTQIQRLVDVQVTQTDIMRGMAIDIHELKNTNVSITELEKRVDALEKYTVKNKERH
ncbi:hypothetical protein [uncultured Microscilla sp.]|uniref:hypothetical protein n=1 Tax=uncultured Microscilla sp. TaxID=432653 RepID=UPI00261ECCEA|nr:hypothetical protein [uncultured Microscilla sp.]